MPGFSTNYGDQPVDVFFTLNAIDNVHIQELNSEMGAYFTLTTDFWVTNETTNLREMAASLTFEETEFTFSAIINNMTLAMKIITVNVDKITANSCTWGNIHTVPDKIAINNAMKVLVPIINSKLVNVLIHIPSHLGKYFVLSDLTLGYFNDYMFLGLTPTFVQPTLS